MQVNKADKLHLCYAALPSRMQRGSKNVGASRWRAMQITRNVQRTRAGLPSGPVLMAVLVASSRMPLDSFPPTPFRALLSDLLRVSLAFTSTGRKPSSLQRRGKALKGRQ